jgi:hypothetical protein
MTFRPLSPKETAEELLKEQGYNEDIEKEINGDPAIEEGDLERDLPEPDNDTIMENLHEMSQKDVEELNESGIYEEE